MNKTKEERTDNGQEHDLFDSLKSVINERMVLWERRKKHIKKLN